MMIRFANAANSAPTLEEIASARFVKPEGREYPLIGLTIANGDEFMLPLNPGEDRENTINYLNGLPGVGEYRDWKAIFAEKWFNHPFGNDDPCYQIKVAVIFLNYSIQIHKAMVQVAPMLQIEIDRYPLHKIDKSFQMWGGYYEKMMAAATQGDLSWIIEEVTDGVKRLMAKDARKAAKAAARKLA